MELPETLPQGCWRNPIQYDLLLKPWFMYHALHTLIIFNSQMIHSRAILGNKGAELFLGTDDNPVSCLSCLKAVREHHDWSYLTVTIWHKRGRWAGSKIQKLPTHLLALGPKNQIIKNNLLRNPCLHPYSNSPTWLLHRHAPALELSANLPTI